MSFVKSIVRGTTHPFDLQTQLDPGQIFLKPANKSAQTAILTQEQQDAAAAAKAQTDAALEANNQRVATKRAYQANALALGGNDDDSLGAPGLPASVLASGATPAARAAAAGAGTATALGSGAVGASNAGYSYGATGGSRSSTARALVR